MTSRPAGTIRPPPELEAAPLAAALDRQAEVETFAADMESRRRRLAEVLGTEGSGGGD